MCYNVHLFSLVKLQTEFDHFLVLRLTLPTIKRTFVAPAKEFDIENPTEPEPVPGPQEPYFELAEQMPHLSNPNLMSKMRRTISDVVESQSALRALGPKPDHEAVDDAWLRLVEIDAYHVKGSCELQEVYKVGITLEDMHGAYELILSEAEQRLEKTYIAAVAGDELNVGERMDFGEGEEVDDKVVEILTEVESGKKFESVDLLGKRSLGMLLRVVQNH